MPPEAHAAQPYEAQNQAQNPQQQPQTGYTGFTVHLLSTSPAIWLVKNLLTPDECDYLIAVSEKRLEPSTTVDPATGELKAHPGRTSYNTYFQLGENTVIQQLEQRIAQITQMPIENGEGMQVLRYEDSQEYQPHFDFFPPQDPGSAVHLATGGQRVATVLTYLGDVEKGGETIFPEVCMKVIPKKGNAVIFLSVLPNGDVDPMSLHGSCPVEKGTKWTMTKWIRERKYCTGG